MAIIDSFTESLSRTNTMKMAINRAIQNIKINDTNEYVSLNQIKHAISCDNSNTQKVYMKIMKLERKEYDKKLFNLSGWYRQDLDFHFKYLPTSTLNTTLENRANKIVQENTLLNDEEVDNSLFRTVQTKLDVFGKCLIFISDYVQNNFNESNFEVIEPTRYLIEKDSILIYSYLGKSEKGNIVYKRLNVSEKETTEQKCEIIENSIKVISSERKKINFQPFYEIKGKEKLSNIKENLAMLSLIETVLATEIKNSQFSIHADEKYFSNGQIIQSDFFRIYQTSQQDTPPLYESFQPDLRQEDYRELKTMYKEEIASALGMSTRSLGIANSDVLTATGELLLEESTMQTINASKDLLSKELNKFLKIYFNSVISIPLYISDNLALRSDIIQKLNGKISIEKTVVFLNPTFTIEERMREVVLIKLENAISLTEEEYKFAEENNLIGINFDNLGV